MKVRTILVIISLVFLLLTSYFLLVPTFLVGIMPRASAFSESMLASPDSTPPTVAPTPSPTSQSLSDSFTNFEDAFSSPLIAALKLVAAVVVLLLIIHLLFHLLVLFRHRSFHYNLVVGPFNNATGYDGLNQLTREDLSPQLKYVKRFVPGLQFFNQRADAVLSDPLQTTLDTLDKAMSGDAFKSGEIGAALQLLNLLISPRGSNVTITLQSKGDLPATLGMSIEVADLQGKQKPTLHTIWESLPTVDDKSPILSVPNKTIDPEALGYYTLGQLYEKRAAYDEAKSQYESALSKQPDYQDAIDHLKLVLDNRQTTEEHYIALQKPVARWLAIEIVKRSMEAKPRLQFIKTTPWFSIRENKKREDEYRAKLYNLIGEIYESSSQLLPICPSFYDLAIQHFELARESNKSWFQPYENLADTYVMMVQGTPASKPLSDEDRKIRLTQALYNYQIALRKCLDEEQKRRIKVGEAIAQLMTDHPKEANSIITNIESHWTEKCGAAAEKDSLLLYNLACWYGIVVSKAPDEKAAQDARRYLAYSLGRDETQELWTWAVADPSFIGISNTPNSTEGIQKDLKLLTAALTKKIDEGQQLPKMEGDKFEVAMNAVMTEAHWL